MKHEPPVTLGLTTPGRGYTDAAGQPIKIFRCPTCKEYINTSMTQCRFCGAQLDQAAFAHARVQERIDRICSLPKMMSRFWFLPIVFWAGAACIYVYRRWVPASLLNFLFTPAFLLAFIIGVALQLKAIDVGHPNLETARRMVTVSLLIWVLAFPVPAIILFVARPDLLGPIFKMLLWGITHVVIPYPY